jgi:LmbE family N-acetylglucosaminyl deacetylase
MRATTTRDHVRIAEATTAAFARAATSNARLYHWVIPTSIITPWLAEVRASGMLDAYVDLDLGRPDADVTTVVDVRAVAGIRRAAIAEHRTQTSPFSAVSPELYDKILANDYFVRVVPAWSGGPPETAL